MIKYTIDSTLTLRETPVFRNGMRGASDYDRKNSSADGFSLSNASKRKIKQCVSGYFLENEHVGKNLSWVTLTVPPRMDGFSYQEWFDDSAIIKQLSKFLENLRRNHGLKNYIWVAERQDGKRNNFKFCTGAIHFHCIFDFRGFVDYRNLNLYWLKLVNELGFKAFSKKALIKMVNEKYFSIEKTYERNKKDFFAHIAKDLLKLPEYRKLVHSRALSEYSKCKEVLNYQSLRKCFNGIDPMCFNPNHPICKMAYQPYDAEKIEIKDFSMLQTYLTKYVTKNETRIFGRVWGASRGFTSVNYELQITAAEAAAVKEIEEIKICEKESSFEIGLNKFTTLSTKLSFDKFKQSDVYLRLMDSIITQRLNPEKNTIPEHVPVHQHFNFVSDAFVKLRANLLFVNDEMRMESIALPPSFMPIDWDFDKRNDDIYMRKKEKNPVCVQSSLEFDIENDSKTFKY